MGVIIQVLGTSVICFISLNLGITVAWPSCTLKIFGSTNTTLNRPMTETEQALLGSLSSFGAILGTMVAGYTMDNLGRKYSAVLSSLMFVIAWVIIAVSGTVEAILAAMFVFGLGGAAMLVVRVYVSEICQASIRGAMPTGSLVFYTIGLLISYVMGALEYMTMVYMCLTMAVCVTVLLAVLTESPTYLMKKGLDEEAAKSIAFYRSAKVSSKEVMTEMETLRKAFHPVLDGNTEKQGGLEEEEKLKPLGNESHKPEEKLTFWQFLKKSRSTRKALVVVTVLVSASIFQGVLVVQVYAKPLFEEAVPGMSSTLCSIIQALVTLVSGLIAAYLTEVAGRRPLHIYSSIAAAISCLLLGSQLHVHWAPQWVTAFCIYLFCFTYTVGAGCVPFVLVTDVFLPEVKSFISMFIVEWMWMCSFIVLFVYNPLVSVITLGPIFYIFAVISLFSAVYAYLMLPETKGLPVHEVQALFE